MESKFNILYEEIVNEMNENSFYPAKDVDGKQLVGKNYKGEEQIWMIGPTMEKSVVDHLSGEKIPQFTTVLWLPNAKAHKKGIAISIDSYEEAAKQPEEKEKLEAIGLVNTVDFENA